VTIKFRGVVFVTVNALTVLTIHIAQIVIVRCSLTIMIGIAVTTARMTTMIETCSICGFSGSADRYIPHDCYWVLRERGLTALQHLQQRLKEPASVGAVREDTDLPVVSTRESTSSSSEKS
jgi:hypothetical protein